MSNGALTQEEIDRLLNPTPDDTAVQSVDALSQMESDIIGEVGNISMSQAATTLSELLGKQVRITTPRVQTTTVATILKESHIPKVITSITFKKGITGKNMLILDVSDSASIANLMMGGDGQAETDTLGEIELSAVAEAMNQMIGSASTAMATMLDRTVDIYPPSVNMWDEENEHNMDEDLETTVCEISFELEVEGILKSTIMQVFSLDAVHDITELMLGDEAIVVTDHVEEQPVPVVAPVEEVEKVSVHKPEFQQLDNQPTHHQPQNLDLIMDVPLEFSVMLGESKKTIRDILSLGTGSVVELDKMTEEPLSIYVNGKMIAEGEVVVINENFGIRITNILSKEKRLNNI
ncbi:flagellar motor switch phosphatase FliY [Jeotgalibaca caeni]|uniref:flagellar motor switch phosphatase FliY n=1 Tax=Jeotgalibaca caeni TaxID=3028623 RepID=UPI00237D8FA0|nr:flagellar motor switch phosphatase FliY [Jeotgalibaca caeni]MDE1548298.1 flagellar motor switch phosphatase FliY [Jeotgalibaca caeni]